MTIRDNDKTILGCLGVILWVAVMIPVASIFSGWVLVRLWHWFVVPTFHLPDLSIAPAIGIASIVSFLTYQSCKTDDDDGDTGAVERLAKATMMVLLRPAMAYLFGAVVAQFM